MSSEINLLFPNLMSDKGNVHQVKVSKTKIKQESQLALCRAVLCAGFHVDSWKTYGVHVEAMCEVPVVSRYDEWCILDVAKIQYCFGQVTSVTDDLS